MRRRDRIAVLAVVLLSIGIAKLGQQLYRWQAFEVERTAIERLERELESAALGVISTQVAADTLRGSIRAADEVLDSVHGWIDRLEGNSVGALLATGQESLYRRQLREYNEQVTRRNELVGRWRATLDENHAQVDRYNALADSIRTFADVMGEPYYPIRTPAEIAVAHGFVHGAE